MDQVISGTPCTIVLKHARAIELISAICYGYAAAFAVTIGAYYRNNRYMYILRFQDAAMIINIMLLWGTAVLYYCYKHRKLFYTDVIEVADTVLADRLEQNQRRIRLLERMIYGGMASVAVPAALIAITITFRSNNSVNGIHLLCCGLICAIAIYLVICAAFYIRLRLQQRYLIESAAYYNRLVEPSGMPEQA